MRLARAGKRILMLERGPFLPREKSNGNTKAVLLHPKSLSPTLCAWLTTWSSGLVAAPDALRILLECAGQLQESRRLNRSPWNERVYF